LERFDQRGIVAIEGLDAAARYLETLINVEGGLGEGIDRDGLGAMRDLMHALDHPERCAPSLHVAGSKGKGSVVLFADAILSMAGERVGAFTSPHLARWTERYRIAGVEVDGPAFAAAVRQLQPLVDAARRHHARRAPSFFDAATAAAFLLFRSAGVDRMVLEVGLGGRLDATNVVEPQVTCISHLELEHTDRLGETLPEIAFEKGGILKPRVPCVVGALAPAAREVIVEIARERDVPLFELGRDFTAAVEPCADPLQGSRLIYRDLHGLEIATNVRSVGSHQAVNAALAIACVARSETIAPEELHTAVSRALPDCVLPGRLEVLGHRPLLLIDAAHTPDSANALARLLVSVPSAKTHLVLSVSAGKRLGQVLRPILGALPAGSAVTITRADKHRSLDPAEVRTAIEALDGERRLNARVVPNPHLALRAARDSAREDEMVLATGSVYLAGIARDVFREASPGKVLVSRRASSDSGDPP
jgi:dihydrofolate synthase/folylpolyglutamate synthase